MDTGVGSDKWMLERGFIPMTPEESEAHKDFFTPCVKREEATHIQKTIDLVRTLLNSFRRTFSDMQPENDANKEALRKVEEITNSDPVKGEDLLESEDLKRKLGEAKKRLSEPSGEEPV